MNKGHITAIALILLTSQGMLVTTTDARNLGAAFKAASSGAKTHKVVTAARSTKQIANSGGGSLARSNSVSSTYKSGSGSGSLARNFNSHAATVGTGQGSLARTATTPTKPVVFSQPQRATTSTWYKETSPFPAREAAKQHFRSQMSGYNLKVIRAGRNQKGKVLGVGTVEGGKRAPTYRPKMDGSYSSGRQKNIDHFRPNGKNGYTRNKIN